MSYAVYVLFDLNCPVVIPAYTFVYALYSCHIHTSNYMRTLHTHTHTHTVYVVITHTLSLRTYLTVCIALSTQLVRFIPYTSVYGTFLCFRKLYLLRRAVSILRFIETYPNVFTHTLGAITTYSFMVFTPRMHILYTYNPLRVTLHFIHAPHIHTFIPRYANWKRHRAIYTCIHTLIHAHVPFLH